MLKDIFLLCFSFLLLISNFNILMAQDTTEYTYVFPSAKEFSFNSTCKVSKFSGFKYSYTISCNNNSKQDIKRVMIQVCSAVKFISSPLNWNGGKYNTPKKDVKWFTIDSVSRIQEGESLKGFSFVSNGLPVITNIYCRGYRYVPPVTFEPEYIEGDDIYENSVLKKTIGPKTIGHIEKPELFIEEIISMGNAADSLNWIESESYMTCSDYKESLTWKNLKAKLKSISPLLEQKKYDEAGLKLKSCLENVKQLHSVNQLSDEAFALLFYNVEYLVNFIDE